MALNPIAYTERIVKSFLRYQLTTHHALARVAGGHRLFVRAVAKSGTSPPVRSASG